MRVDLATQSTQAAFAAMVGISPAAVSQMMGGQVLRRDDTLGAWLLAYCARLREQAAGRMGETEGLDLAQERAALARSQREGQDIKNAVARKEYAPVGLLADVLGAASAGVVDRFEQLEGKFKKAVPDMPEAARVVVMDVIASARNEWIKSTMSLVAAHLDATTCDDDEAEDGGA